MDAIQCRVCNQGQLFSQKVRRLSGPAVTIGYILLVPSILGIVLSMGFLVMAWVGAAGMASHTLSATTVQRLNEENVSANLQSKLKDGKLVTYAEMTDLTPGQKAAIETANAEVTAHLAGSGCAAACGTGMATVGAIGSFVGGLIGWLLIMKKRVLMCNRCGATVAAS